eukprot:197508-Rhodomonas_salina.1
MQAAPATSQVAVPQLYCPDCSRTHCEDHRTKFRRVPHGPGTDFGEFGTAERGRRRARVQTEPRRAASGRRREDEGRGEGREEGARGGGGGGGAREEGRDLPAAEVRRPYALATACPVLRARRVVPVSERATACVVLRERVRGTRITAMHYEDERGEREAKDRSVPSYARARRCPVLVYVVPECPVLVLECPVLTYVVLECPYVVILECPVLTYVVLECPALPYIGRHATRVLCGVRS